MPRCPGRLARSFAVLVAAGPLLAGCVDDGAAAGPSVSSSSTAVDDDAATAAIVCGALKDQANAMAAVANSTVADINDLDPDGRYDALYTGFDTAADQVREFATVIDELELPDIAERDDLRAEMAAGADASLSELADEQQRFADAVDTVTEDDTFGRVGQFFNSIEKVDSLVEPVIARYGRVEFQQAFLDEPLCEHVIQPFDIVPPTPTSSGVTDVGA